MGKVIPFAPTKRRAPLEQELDTLAELQKRFSSGLDEHDNPLSGQAVTRTFVDFNAQQQKLKNKYDLSPQDIQRALEKRGALPKRDPTEPDDATKKRAPPEPGEDPDPDPGPQCA